MIVLRGAVRAAERAGFDLTAVRHHGEVCNRCVLGFTRAMAEHGGADIFYAAHRRATEDLEPISPLVVAVSLSRKVGKESIGEDY